MMRMLAAAQVKLQHARHMATLNKPQICWHLVRKAMASAEPQVVSLHCAASSLAVLLPRALSPFVLPAGSEHQSIHETMIV